MNSIWIVLPILLVLMFVLGLEFRRQDIAALWRQPRALWAGLAAQIFVLPLLAFTLGVMFRLEPYFFLGLVLIACSPGGSSSNVFTMLARGDVALSVSLTLFSSIITVFTIPPVMLLAMQLTGMAQADAVQLPVARLLLQNVVLVLLPMACGMMVRRFAPSLAQAIAPALKKTAFPALMLLAAVFFVEHRHTIAANFSALTVVVTLLIMAAMACAVLIAKAVRLNTVQRRTIVIEVGMQNAAQAMAIAAGPFVFNNPHMAIPAIIYALMMNVILLSYVGRFLLPSRRAA
ncbi:MAG: bile acid:sodium symporter family protein [Neisseria sp.]|nr:bile acid:sodium symporter family protein [Neisseria sp.]